MYIKIFYCALSFVVEAKGTICATQNYYMESKSYFALLHIMVYQLNCLSKTIFLSSPLLLKVGTLYDIPPEVLSLEIDALLDLLAQCIECWSVISQVKYSTW